MPFKLKLKKSRHYSVASKTLFVISVELLDGTNVECTLSNESTGQDCLDVVCQKLGLAQPKFFGLQYVRNNGENTLYWVELDRPIKRQLDKCGTGLCVYLRVMFYIISGVRLISDEITRYHYFLQLKMDVIEGRISCTLQQSIELASYSMQAEFGNFDAERHTANYLKDFQLFPKIFTDPALLESLTDAASQQHALLNNLPQGTAEEYYICACQHLEGYGQEIFAVKDRLGDDAIISVSLTDISISYAGEREGRHYSWTDIKNVINHKKFFTIETASGKHIQFQFGDVETARNAWRFCVSQHTFFKQYEMNNNQANKGAAPPSTCQQTPAEGNLRQAGSCENVTNLSTAWDRSVSTQSLNQRTQSTSCLDLNKATNIEVLRSLLPSYRPAPDYETAIQHKLNNSADAIPSHQPPVRNTTRAILYSSQPEIHQADRFQTDLRYSDVIHGNMEQKNIVRAAMYNPPFTQTQIASENEDKFSENVQLLHLYKQPPPYPNNRISFNSTPDLAVISQNENHPSYFLNAVSGSSPDLVSDANLFLKPYSQTLYQTHQAHPVHRSQSFLPPQHGTYENLSAMFHSNRLSQPAAAAVVVGSSDISKHIKKVYDKQGNIIYCMPANIKHHLEQQNQMANAGFVIARNRAIIPQNVSKISSTEPIYENIPLPWGNENEETRARTQSIHSAPEISRAFTETTTSNPVQSQLKYLNTPAPSSFKGSRESVYANVNRNHATHTSNSELSAKFHNSNELSQALNESTQDLMGSRHQEFQKTSTPTSTASAVNPYVSFANTSNAFSNDSSSNISQPFDLTSSSNTSSNKSKKKRWGILIGRSKVSEKSLIKSATLGRETDKKSSQSSHKHWSSTGMPRFNPLPPSISKETMCQLLENKLADSQLFFEFDEIPKKKQSATFTTALHRDNAPFNRFKDVLPYEDNRLRLTPSKNNKFGYINASHITATVGSKQRFYIAAQGPTRATILYFWQCIWEAEVYLIVQLTDSSEDFMYVPDARERCIDISQEYQVWWEFSQNAGNCVTSKLRLCHVPSRRYRTLWHLHYTNWGDQGCPISVSHYLGFLEEMQSVHQHSMEEIPPGHNKNPPVLVHCTAGVGRTGLTILCDLLMYTVDHNQEVCIPRVLELLRYQRAYMIQTIAQYRFVYSLLIHYLKQTRLI